jgi:acyl CoA:acetate/3-ketoacid CoA transferase beta subunit
MIQVSRAEVCVIACAELFRDAGEIMVSPMTTIVSIGARLARLTFSPDILLSDGEARLLAEWILADRLPVRMQTQLHKIIWDPQARGV